ncbi:hypothetical protein F5I97DRAFT_1652748 [Phlebopus sp. FC_14]|nr:hypothetical protein F5I97DRAFT_1652748 [Phlebopus sp. FC_14]
MTIPSPQDAPKPVSATKFQVFVLPTLAMPRRPESIILDIRPTARSTCASRICHRRWPHYHSLRVRSQMHSFVMGGSRIWLFRSNPRRLRLTRSTFLSTNLSSQLSLFSNFVTAHHVDRNAEAFSGCKYSLTGSYTLPRFDGLGNFALALDMTDAFADIKNETAFMFLSCAGALLDAYSIPFIGRLVIERLPCPSPQTHCGFTSTFHSP